MSSQDNQQIMAPSGEIRGSATKLEPAARMDTRPSDTLTATSSWTGSGPGTGALSRTQTKTTVWSQLQVGVPTDRIGRALGGDRSRLARHPVGVG